MKRKGPPYQVTMGRPGERPPAYVLDISGGRVIVRSTLLGLLRRRLKKKYRYSESGDLTKNQELISILLRLNEQGVAFGYDYKIPICPSDFMKELQDTGELNKPFKEISWQNPREWVLTTYEME